GAVIDSASLPAVADPAWRLVAALDMNVDGWPDLVWRNAVTGRTTVTYMNGTTVIGAGEFGLIPDLNWNILRHTNVHRAGDFTGDRRADLLWRNKVDGTNSIWVKGATIQAGTLAVPPQPDLNWHLIDSADFNGDGWLDLVWHNVTTGAVQIGYGPDFATIATLATVAPDPTWRLMAAADLDGDGIPELVWRNTATGGKGVWFLN